MIGPELDLDAPAPPQDLARRRIAGPGVVLTALILVALATGGLAGALLAPPEPPRAPPVATLAARDVYVDPATDASTVARIGTLVGKPVVVARIVLENPGRVTARATGVVIDGVNRRRIVEPVDLRVAPGGSAFADVALHPECTAAGRTGGGGPKARLLSPTEPSGRIEVSLSLGLGATNGFCDLLDTRLPTGWRTPIDALGTRPAGADLLVTVEDLSGERLTGIKVDEDWLPTVFAGDQLVTTSVHVSPGQDSVMRLHGPPPCLGSTGVAPIPTTMRLLVHAADGALVQRLVIVGPELSRWLRQSCPK